MQCKDNTIYEDIQLQVNLHEAFALHKCLFALGCSYVKLQFMTLTEIFLTKNKVRKIPKSAHNII